MRRALGRAEELRDERARSGSIEPPTSIIKMTRVFGRRGGRVTTSSSPAFFAVASIVPSMSSSSLRALAREARGACAARPRSAARRARGRCGTAGTCARPPSASRSCRRRRAPTLHARGVKPLAAERATCRRCRSSGFRRRAARSARSAAPRTCASPRRGRAPRSAPSPRRRARAACFGSCSHSRSSSAIFFASTSTPRKCFANARSKSSRCASECTQSARATK